MKRYVEITKVKVYAGDDLIGTVRMSDGIGYKAKLSDTFMSSDDIAFVGKVLEYLEADETVKIEEEIG